MTSSWRRSPKLPKLRVKLRVRTLRVSVRRRGSPRGRAWRRHRRSSTPPGRRRRRAPPTTTAKGTPTAANGAATRQSTKPRLAYPIRPEVNPKHSVMSATLNASAGDSSANSGPRRGNPSRKMGVKSAAPPMPVSIAVVATPTETGNMNAYRVQCAGSTTAGASGGARPEARSAARDEKADAETRRGPPRGRRARRHPGDDDGAETRPPPAGRRRPGRAEWAPRGTPTRAPDANEARIPEATRGGAESAPRGVRRARERRRGAPPETRLKSERSSGLLG